MPTRRLPRGGEAGRADAVDEHDPDLVAGDAQAVDEGAYGFAGRDGQGVGIAGHLRGQGGVAAQFDGHGRVLVALFRAAIVS